MKKGLLLLLGMLMMVSTVEATDGVQTNSKKDYRKRYSEKPIQFFEKGIKFYVYPDGEFDFNTHTRSRYTTQYVYRNGKRYKTSGPFSKVRISRDYYGRIKSVGNTYINYNRFGKISRVGSVFIDYNRRKMTRVGGLRIKYDRFGNVRYYGQVKHRYHNRTNRFIGSIFDYNDDFFYNDGFYNDYEDYGEDDDYYYYKSKNNKKGVKKDAMIKRKKFKKAPHKDRKRRK
jgi:hypothetical protein